MVEYGGPPETGAVLHWWPTRHHSVHDARTVADVALTGTAFSATPRPTPRGYTPGTVAAEGDIVLRDWLARDHRRRARLGHRAHVNCSS